MVSMRVFPIDPVRTRCTFPIAFTCAVALVSCQENDSNSAVSEDATPTESGEVGTEPHEVGTTHETTNGTEHTTGVSIDTGAATETATHESTCAPADGDSECLSCVKPTCCSELDACITTNENCICVIDCLAQLDDPDQRQAMACASNCGAGHELLGPLQTLGGCLEIGGCDVCGSIVGFEPMFQGGSGDHG